MNYEKLIQAFGLTYLKGPVQKTFIGDKFCIVDNFLSDSDSDNRVKMQTGKADIRFPIKISLGFCLYCKTGVVSARVQQKDYVVQEGGVLVIFAGNILESASLSDDCRLIYIAIDSDYMMTGIRTRYGRALRQWILRSTQPTLLYPKSDDVRNFERLCDCVRHIVDSGGWSDESESFCANYSDGVLAGFTSIYGNLLLNWAESASARTHEEQTREMTVAERVLYIFRNDVHSFSAKYRAVDYYAKRQNLSVRHFSRLITQASGRKAHEIIKEYVILEAKSLLLTGRYSVREVADMLGFQNYSFFNRYFKSAVGRTPGDYIR